MKLMGLTKYAGIAAAVCLSGGVAFGQASHTVDSGLTTVQVSSTFGSALAAAKVTTGTVGATQISNGVAGFPIVGGAVDLDTAKGNVVHSGGLTFTAGANKVQLDSIILDTTGSTIQMTALVELNGQLLYRLAAFNVTPPAGTTLPLKETNNSVDLKGFNVTLTSQAANSLDAVFATKVFTAGMSVGTADLMVNFLQ